MCWLYGKSAGLHYVSNIIFVNFNGIFIIDISINVVIVQHIHITMSYKLTLLTPQESVFKLVTFCFSYFHFPPFIFFIKKAIIFVAYEHLLIVKNCINCLMTKSNLHPILNSFHICFSNTSFPLNFMYLLNLLS